MWMRSNLVVAAKVVLAKGGQSEVVAVLGEAFEDARRDRVLADDDRRFSEVAVTFSQLALDRRVVVTNGVLFFPQLEQYCRSSARSSCAARKDWHYNALHPVALGDPRVVLEEVVVLRCGC